MALKVRAEVAGLAEACFPEAAEAATAGCPVSNALIGVEARSAPSRSRRHAERRLHLQRPAPACQHP